MLLFTIIGLTRKDTFEKNNFFKYDNLDLDKIDRQRISFPVLESVDN